MLLIGWTNTVNQAQRVTVIQKKSEIEFALKTFALGKFNNGLVLKAIFYKNGAKKSCVHEICRIFPLVNFGFTNFVHM